MVSEMKQVNVDLIVYVCVSFYVHSLECESGSWRRIAGFLSLEPLCVFCKSLVTLYHSQSEKIK